MVVVLVTLTFINLPLFVDFWIVNLQATTLTRAAELFEITITISANLMGFYSVFYSELYNNFQGTKINTKEKALNTRMMQIMLKREHLQEMIFNYKDLDYASKINMCSKTTPSTE